MKRRTARVIRVFRSPLDRTRGRIVGPGIDLACALGRAGPGRGKREGDGLTPIGRFRAIGALYRPDRMRRPATSIPLGVIHADLGWADDPQDRRYNRPIPLPSPCGHERMWREDALYDLVLDLSYNRGPIVRGRGSAIFLHSARPGFLPTEGCVAVERARIRALVERIGPDTVIEIVG
jgi:L,D-peptidoglycan transpeptidase YkuD (ErfK/YbiS/YcfS/YnhG family)